MKSGNHDKIVETLIKIIEPWVGDPESIRDVSRNSHLIADLGLDSIGILQVILSIEKDLGIRISNDEIDGNILSRIGNLAELVGVKMYEDQ